MKMYEDHKKNANPKSNELINAQRPISSYQRNLYSENNRKETNEDHPKTEANDINVGNVTEKFNKFISKNKIARNEFCDNSNIYLDQAEFKELFKKVRFEISTNELNFLFTHNNPNLEEGYILMNNFLTHNEFNWKELQIGRVDTNYDIKKINQDFKQLNDEVLDIVKNDLIQTYNAQSNNANKTHNKRIFSSTTQNTKKKEIRIDSGTSTNKMVPMSTMSNSKFNNTRPFSSIIKINQSSMYNLDMTAQSKPDPIKKLLNEKLKKQREEDENMQKTINKKNIDFLNDCLKKIVEANKMSQDLYKNKVYTSIKDDVIIIF